MKQISILKNQYLNIHILYDGLVTSKRKKEYNSQDGLVNCISKDLSIDRRRPLKVYIKGYSAEERVELKQRLESLFDNISYS